MLVTDAHEQRIVERVIALRRDGLSRRRTAETLNREGLRTRAGGEWRNESVMNLLRRSVGAM